MNKYSVPRYLYRITMKVLFVMLILAAASIRSVAQIKAAVAANMKFAFEDIKTAFSKKTGYEVISVYGSSGRLVSQIRNGAPFDLFISADTGFIDSICVSGLNAGKPEIYAFGKLVLWTVKSMDLSRGVSLLADSSIRTVAFGDMKLTVYGPAARDCLKKVDLWDNVKDKAVYASNISHVAHHCEWISRYRVLCKVDRPFKGDEWAREMDRNRFNNVQFFTSISSDPQAWRKEPF